MYTLNIAGYSQRMLEGIFTLLDERCACYHIEPGDWLEIPDKGDYDVATAWLEGWRARQEWLLVDERERELHGAGWRGHLAKGD